MSGGAAAGAAGGAAAAAARMRAVTSAGVITRLAPDDFADVLTRQATPLVVHAVGGFFTTKYHYLTSYKGLAFVTTSPVELELPAGVELIVAKSISPMV
jgi:hypothetical protein